jgi:hypothetical protein
MQRCQGNIPTTIANAIKMGNFRTNLLVVNSFSISNIAYIDAASLGSYNMTELDQKTISNPLA